MIFIKNRKKFFTVLSLCLIAVVGVCIFHDFLIPGSIQKTFGIENNAVDKIELFDGDYGTKHTISDKAQIQKFLSIFDGVSVKKDINQSQMTGSSLNASLYSKGSLQSSFSFGYDKMHYKNTNYISNKNFDAHSIAEIESTYQLKRK